MENINQPKTLTEFQKFIDDNKVENPTQLQKRFPIIFNSSYFQKVRKDLIYQNKRSDYSKDFNTIEDFQNFIDKNEIKRASDFESLNASLYLRMGKLGFSKKVVYESPGKLNWKFLNTPEDFQKFIDDEGLKSPGEFETKYSGCYDRLLSFGFGILMEYPERTKVHRVKENTMESIQKYIDDNNILSPGDLRNRTKKSHSIYRKASRDHILRDLKFPERNSNSYGEILAKCILRDNEIDFEEQKTFDWLVFENKQFLDFYIPSKNIAIEINGLQHFSKVDFFGGEERFLMERKRDENKYKLCLNNGISVLYFIPIDRSWKNIADLSTYFAPVYELTEENLLKYIFA